MASSGKRKTTMAKLNRESKLRERRAEKAARKDARKRAAALPDEPSDAMTSDDPVETDDVAPVEGDMRTMQGSVR
jgi:hypothetical protein